jgi:hypothetical protein
MSESNALVQLSSPEQQALLAGGGIGLEDVYIKPTYVELIQRTTRRKDVKTGVLFDVLTGTEYEKMQVVPLALRRGRVYFPEGGGLGAKPLCRSSNGIQPSEFAQFKQASLCANCPKGSWENYDRKTGQGKPECKESWELLFVMRDNGLPRKITIGGMSLAPTKNLLEHIKQDAIISRANKEGNRNIFDYTFTITPQFIEGAKGSYYILGFKDVKRIQDIGEFGPLFMTYVQSKKAQQAEVEDAQGVVDEVVEAEVQI